MSDNELAVTDLQALALPDRDGHIRATQPIPRGTSYAAVALRKVLFERISPARLARIVDMVLDQAEFGCLDAAKEVLDRIFGRPQVSIDISSDVENEYRYERRVAEDTRTITALLMLRDEHLSPQPHTGRPAIPAGYSAFSPCQGKKSADAQDIVVEAVDATSPAVQDAPGGLPTPAPDISLDAAALPPQPDVVASIAALEAARAAAAAYDDDERAAYAIAAKRRGIAAAKAKDKAKPRYPCHKPGCKRRVLVAGGYCASHVLQQQRASGLTPSDWRGAEAARLAQETPHPLPPSGGGLRS